jgi:hypothetical protein
MTNRARKSGESRRFYVWVPMIRSSETRDTVRGVRCKARRIELPSLILGALGLSASVAACSGATDSQTAAVLTPGSAPSTVAGQAAPVAMVPSATSLQPMAAGSVGAAPGSAPMMNPATPATPAGSMQMPATPAPGGATLPVADATWCGVKRTLDSRCTACHNEMKTAGAPMSLKTHADLIAPAVSDPTKKVFQVVGVRVHDKMRPMPPQGDLTPEQLTSIDTWIAAGAPAGADPSCAGSAMGPATDVPAWPDNCDETYTIYASNDDQPNTVGAGMETHPNFTIAPPWGAEEAQAIAWRSINDNMKVLHHWILYGPNGEFLFGWAPGKDNNSALPPDVGMYLPAETMTLNMHYNNVTGTQEEKDKSGVEICVLRKAHFRPKMAAVTMSLVAPQINIPAHSVDYPVTGTCAHTGGPVQLLSASPHAHRNATHMKFTLKKASGETIVMHDKPFNFEEQTTEPIIPGLVVANGDMVITTCTFNNDTDQVITFGENTGNEMCFNFAITEPMNGLTCGRGGARL